MVTPFVEMPSHSRRHLKITFPTDPLIKEFEMKNPGIVQEPVAPDSTTPSLSFQFACRQYELMQKGIDKETAYERTLEMMQEESEAKIRANRRLIESARKVAGTGTVPSFLANEDVYNRLLEWKELLSEKPYEMWEKTSKAALLKWITTDVMRYKDSQLKAARSLNDGTIEEIEANAQDLLHSLFPGSIFHKGKVGMRYRFDDPEWIEQHQSWSKIVRKNPKAYLWDLKTRVDLSDWILRECLNPTQLELEMDKIYQDKRANDLVWEVHLAKLELFPGIRLHKLQTPDPFPQPSLIEGLPPTMDVSLISSVQSQRFVPYKGGPRVMGTGTSDGLPHDPNHGWAYASVAGGKDQQEMMDLALDDSYKKIKDKHFRNRMALRKRELMNPIEKTLLDSARLSRRIDEATDAKAFEELRLLNMNDAEDLPQGLAEYGISPFFEKIQSAGKDMTAEERAEALAKEAEEWRKDEMMLEAKRRRKAKRLEREARLAAEDAEIARLEGSNINLPQLRLKEKPSPYTIKM